MHELILKMNNVNDSSSMKEFKYLQFNFTYWNVETFRSYLHYI